MATIAGIWTYGQFVSPVLEGDAEPPAPTTAAPPQLTSQRPEDATALAATDVEEKGAYESREDAAPSNPEQSRRAETLFASGIQAEQDGDLLIARSHLTEAVQLGLPDQHLIDARAALVRIGAETVFGGRVIPGDPLVDRYVVQAGDSLSKIAGKYQVTADFLARINNIRNKNVIQLGQNLKVVRGPFHARVHKGSFGMDIYLQDTFVRHYRVGLGKDGSTPTGEWIVGTKLTNPTYYPPRGGRMIAADDPENPLGERWIELIGVGGNAVGQQRYGIHGTIEPDSIGRSESMGCIRLHNEDVAEVYTLLVPKASHVWVD